MSAGHQPTLAAAFAASFLWLGINAISLTTPAQEEGDEPIRLRGKTIALRNELHRDPPGLSGLEAGGDGYRVDLPILRNALGSGAAVDHAELHARQLAIQSGARIDPPAPVAERVIEVADVAAGDPPATPVKIGTPMPWIIGSLALLATGLVRRFTRRTHTPR
ncbi:MAG: hypothetical protein EXS13_08790 [Planctomycetes bacterium]|nr:hypothetical protein [Planctomycetota bacterium]